MTVTFEAINPDLSNAGAEFLGWVLTQYLDKACVFDGKAAGSIPIASDGWLDMLHDGKIVFRGFIDTVEEEDDGAQSISAKDLWASLDEVYAQVYEFPALTTLNDILSSDVPTAGKVLGLLWMLNSAVPQGEAVVYSGETYKLTNYGTGTRCGTAAIYVDTTLLTLGASKSTLARGQYWRDAADLYLRCPDGRDPKYWVVSITNYRDSRLRRGTISLGTSTFPVPYRITKTNFRDIIEKVLLSKSLERELSHVKSTATALGVTYLNAEAIVGRGSDTAPVAEFKKTQTIEFGEQTTGGDVFNALIGAGPGSGYTQVVAAKSNMNSRGHWREKLYSSSLLGEMLSTSLLKIWTDTADPRCWVAEDEDDLSLTPGDYVLITPEGRQPMVKRIKKLVHKSDHSMTAEINQRILDAEDYMRAKSTLLSEFNSFIGTQKTSWSSSFGPTNIDDSSNINVEFSGSAKFTINLPAGTIDTEFPSMFLLRFDIAAFEADIDSSDTPAHDNGGATGSHSGYGGGSTSAKTQTAHSILQQTTVPSGGTGLYVVGADHTHLTGTTGYSTTHAHSVYGNIEASGDCGGSCYVSPSTHYGYFYGDAVVYGYISSGVTSSDGFHQHSGVGVNASSSPWYPVTETDHTHGMPGHYTQDAAAQSHETAHEDAKSREVYTEPKTANLIEYFKAMKETGNSIHYLDVYVTLNGDPISGSPFPNLYIGDTINDVDVSSLVIVGDNFLEIKIKEHTSSVIPVRCAIRGSLSAQYYIGWDSL